MLRRRLRLRLISEPPCAALQERLEPRVDLVMVRLKLRLDLATESDVGTTDQGGAERNCPLGVAGGTVLSKRDAE